MATIASAASPRPVMGKASGLRSALAAWVSVPRLRLGSGLVLLTYAATHLANHALGLVSLAAMERGREVFLAVWRGPPGEFLLLASLLVHPVVSLQRLARRGMAMSLAEALQLASGLLIPSLLVLHVLGTGVLARCCGLDDSYAYFLNLAWPEGAGRQSLLVAVVWLHGCLGLHLWLRLKPWYPRVRAVLLAVAVLLPTLALTGFVSAGREVDRLRTDDPLWEGRLAAAENWPAKEERAWLREAEGYVVNGFAGLVGGALLWRLAAELWRRRTQVRLTYPGGLVVAVPRGLTVLEASRLHGVPHASVCGGRGRCSTCRVRVGGPGRERLPPASTAEAKVLARLGAPADVRLACRIRPRTDLMVTPMLPADAGVAATVGHGAPGLGGTERELVVMFADLRGFTRISEGRLPYDVVFILNRYFRAMGGAVEAAGGHVDKLIGDGVMALFGLAGEREGAALAALDAARRMGEAMTRLNDELGAELAEPLRMGIGLHLGPVIVGEMGHGPATALTAIGDTVNVASRLEAATKDLGAELVLSDAVRAAAGARLEGKGERHALKVRGREGEIDVWALRLAVDLPPGPGRSAARPATSLLRRMVLSAVARPRTA